MTDDSIELMAAGVVGAMLAVSQARRSVVGDLWESESAEVVLRTFQNSADDGSTLAAVLERAGHRWPSALDMLRGAHEDVPDALADVLTGVTAATDHLDAGGRSDYGFLLRNIATATATAAAEDGLTAVSGDHVSAEEREVIEKIDSICS